MAVFEANIGADKTGKPEVVFWLGVKQMRLRSLCESSVSLISGQITQSSPLENERAKACDGVVDVA